MGEHGCIYPKHEPQQAHARYAPGQVDELKGPDAGHAWSWCWGGVASETRCVYVRCVQDRRLNIGMRLQGGVHTYRIANFRGTAAKTKNRLKQMMKHIKAARLHAPKIISRSHRLTITTGSVESAIVHSDSLPPPSS